MHNGPVHAYLDHAASTPMRPEALAVMADVLTGCPGNPSGAHGAARAARLALDDARESIAADLGADPGQVIFTSGGTEAANLAVLGALAARATVPGRTGVGLTSRPGADIAPDPAVRPDLLDPPAPPAPSAPSGPHRQPGTIVVAAMEHHAVLEAVAAARRHLGHPVVTVPTRGDGTVDLDALAAYLTHEVAFVSVMTVNNEIGTVQPLAEVAALARERAPGALLHTDAVQAAPWMAVGELAAGYDLVSVSGHKFGGPKGIGVLMARCPVAPVVVGGGQERERRSGTPNVAGAVAMAAALRSSAARRETEGTRVSALRDRLTDGLLASVPGATETGARELKVPGIAHLCFAGVEGEALVVLLDAAGVAVSAGASCASGATQPSHVLSSMGMSRADASSGIRFSLGWTTTDAEVDHVLDAVPRSVARLRA